MKLFGALVFVLLASSVTAACVHSAIYTSRAENRWPAVGQHVDLDDGAVHVIRAGEDGPVVLMIHGASANAREFTFTLAPRLDHVLDRVDDAHAGARARVPLLVV